MFIIVLLLDVNECNGTGVCDGNATCYDIQGSFECICNTGYSGDGSLCISQQFYTSF